MALIFAGSTYLLVLNKSSQLAASHGLAFGGVFEPQPLSAARIARELGAALGWALATIVQGNPIVPQELVAFMVGSLAFSLIAAGIATLIPRQGMAFAIIYLLVVDPTMGAIPASIHDISVTKQVWLLSGLEKGGGQVAPFLTLAIIGGLWLAIGFWRIKRLEA